MLFVQATEFVARNPNTGQKTTRKEIRVKLIGHYALIYEFNDKSLFVLAIFDTRQNPKKLVKIVTEK